MPGQAPFQRLQLQFAAHLRDPENNPPPAGIEPRRMAVYSDLFFRSISNVLSSSFPVLHRLLPASQWSGLVRDFYATHSCRHPQFWRIAEEFVDYLREERGAVDGDPPFLLELAHYEWVEMALDLSTLEHDAVDCSPEGDLLAGIPVLSPLAWWLVYAWPVHRLSADFQPATPPEQPTCLVVYRDREDQVRFLEINPVTARLLELLETSPDTGRCLLLAVAEELGHPEPEAVVREGASILEGLRRRSVILGTRPAPC
ncbi:MAG: putative DNA-binding domain-containing protein [Chromatiales bacterium]|nr:putative DNA-binding domain-containing protein [Chromatiales bacterium]